VSADQPRRLELDLGLRGEEDSLIELRLDGVDDDHRVVAEDHRSHAEIVADELVAVGVEEVRALAARDDQRGRRDAQTKIAADAAGEVARRFHHGSARLAVLVGAHRRNARHPEEAVSPGEIHRGHAVKRKYIIQPVWRAIQVLQCAGSAPSPLSLKEISGRGGLPKTSVFRYLQTLKACGLIAHDADRDLYRIDAGILSLIPQSGGLQRLREIALPHTRALRRRFNETARACACSPSGWSAGSSCGPRWPMAW
jgi:hypothetical protein